VYVYNFSFSALGWGEQLKTRNRNMYKKFLRILFMVSGLSFTISPFLHASVYGSLYDSPTDEVRESRTTTTSCCTMPVSCRSKVRPVCKYLLCGPTVPNECFGDQTCCRFLIYPWMVGSWPCGIMSCTDPDYCQSDDETRTHLCPAWWFCLASSATCAVGWPLLAHPPTSSLGTAGLIMGITGSYLSTWSTVSLGLLNACARCCKSENGEDRPAHIFMGGGGTIGSMHGPALEPQRPERWLTMPLNHRFQS
jgi:hypothetical protein